MLQRVSGAWARVELAVAAVLAVGVTLLILLNVVTRSAGNAIYWVDEAAIYTMVWMTFLGASAAIASRQQVAITVLTDPLPEGAKRVAAKLVDVAVFAFACAMIYFCWRWYMPLALAEAGFETMAFQRATFNFIYAEPTSTIGIQKWIIWLVMPLFSLGVFLHATAHLLNFSPPGTTKAEVQA
ncbi:TRAP transporter small permease subunit [Rhodobacteraceae bacterium N5(2021)]|uniref:TRAP transporter small permease protein n=1 Tax=Gymnodinialimonas phycosphaerae TaxID=2841589 RepID=A0A975TVE5_9RHOB|nr:TRAP transporter small permease subunit [Gymnodinialimonas phycosphaerae]MBY4891310.1 TRAP transporter small permease subunit [Gymnodinialimonas phycosphaerae]